MTDHWIILQNSLMSHIQGMLCVTYCSLPGNFLLFKIELHLR